MSLKDIDKYKRFTGNYKIGIEFRNMQGTVLKNISVLRARIIGNDISKYYRDFSVCKYDRERD